MDRSLAYGLVAAGLAFLALGALRFADQDLDMGLFLGLVGFAFLVAGLRGATRAGAEAPVAPAAGPPPIPEAAADVDLSGLPRPFHACAACGYLGARPRGFSDGGLPGVAELQGDFICDRCGHRGFPAEFDDPDAYRAFLADLNQPGARA